MKKMSYKFPGIEYIEIVNIPLKKGPAGEEPAINQKAIEELLAKAILEHGLPLRGIELRFLRKHLGLSLASMGRKIAVSDVTILNWEKHAEDRLDLVSEVTLRAFFAESLGVQLPGTLSGLRGAEKLPRKLIRLSAT